MEVFQLYYWPHSCNPFNTLGYRPPLFVYQSVIANQVLKRDVLWPTVLTGVRVHIP